jgi:hypothetical protein
VTRSIHASTAGLQRGERAGCGVGGDGGGHGERSEPLAALVPEAKGMLEQARATEAERARVAAEEAEAAAERLQAEEEVAALTLRLQEAQQRLGNTVAAPTSQPDAEETMCVVCFDAPKEYGHMCVCGPCAEQLTQTRTPMCPVCRGPIRESMKVFCSQRGLGLDEYLCEDKLI